MTKKDYIQFANILKESRDILSEEKKGRKRNITAEGMLLAIERDIADIFSNDSNKFDYGKFMQYIGH